MAMMPRFVPNKMYLDDIFNDFMFSRFKDNNFSSMKCDIYEIDNIYYLEMEVPGFNRDNINIEIDDNDYLTITAICSNNEEDNSNKNYIHKERSYGEVKRSFYIGGIDKDNIDASFIDGMLKITMPKRQEDKSSKRTIEIK